MFSAVYCRTCRGLFVLLWNLYGWAFVGCDLLLMSFVECCCCFAYLLFCSAYLLFVLLFRLFAIDVVSLIAIVAYCLFAVVSLICC